MSRLRLKLAGLLLLVVTALFPAVCSAGGYEWPQYHMGVDSAGYSPSSAPDTNSIIWESEQIGANMSSSPVIAGGRVYVYCCPSDDGFSATSSSIVCLDEATGAKLWETPVDTARWGSYSSPAYDDGKIYIGSGSKAFCLNAGDGTVLWSYTLQYDVVNGSPRVADGKAFFTDWDSNHRGVSYCYCLEANTGKLLWQHPLAGDSQSTPAYDNGKIYVNSWTYAEGAGTGANNTYCLDAGDGHEIWHQQGLKEETCGSPCVGGGKVFVCTYNFYGDGELAALDAGDGHILWGPVAVQRTNSTPAYADGRVYLCGGCYGFSDLATYCFEADTGKEVWRHPGLGSWTCAVAVAGNKVFVGKPGSSFDYSGVYALDAGDGHIVWQSDKGGSSPAVANGRVFTYSGGRVYAFGAGADWSQFQKDEQRSGQISVNTLVLAPRLAWSRFVYSHGGNGIQNTAVINGNTLYVFAGNRLLALSRTTGDALWEKDPGGHGSLQIPTPACGGGKLFIATFDGYVMAFDSRTGEQLWSKKVSVRGFQCPVTYCDGYIYVGEGGTGGDSNSYYCLDESGALRWTYTADTGGYLWCGCSVIGAYVVFGNLEGVVTSVSRETGALADRVALNDAGRLSFARTAPGRIRASVAYRDGYIYTSSENGISDGYLWKIGFDPKTGRFLDSGFSTATGFSTSSPVLYKGRIYLGQGEHGCLGSMLCVDDAGGDILWSYPVENGVKSSPALVVAPGGRACLYFTTAMNDGFLYCLNGDGKLIWKYNPPDTGYLLQGPAAADGNLYLGTGGGYLYCLQEERD